MSKNAPRVAIYGYKMVSNAVRALQAELGILQILHEGSHYKGSKDKVVINYGATKIPPNVLQSVVLNKPHSVANCADKLRFFSHLYDIESEVQTPEWTNDPTVAKDWIDKGQVLLARTVLNGSKGQGIKILRKGIDFVTAPLYTVYIPKEYEYRVHVLGGEVIDIQRKVLQRGIELNDTEKKIRSHDNGWVFSRNPELLKIPSDKIKEQALLCVNHMNLDFGAVDIIWSVKRKDCWVLEVNTAPGQEGLTTKIYGEAFRKFLKLGEIVNKK